MTPQDPADRTVDIALADPAVRAAHDQLRAAARDQRPMDATQDAALHIVLSAILRATIDQLNIPPEILPGALEYAARLFEQDQDG